MRPIPLRFRLRTMLVIVAIAGIVLGGSEILRRRRARCLRMVLWHEASHNGAMMDAAGYAAQARTACSSDSAEKFRKQAKEARNRQRFHREMSRLWARTASHPWEPFPADHAAPDIVDIAPTPVPQY